MRVSRDQVDKLFPDIIDKLGYNKKELNLEWLESIIDFLSNMGLFFKILFFAAVIALILFIAYKIVMNLSKNNNKFKMNNINAVPEGNISLSDILKEIAKHKLKKDYKLATIYLHHATICRLLDKKIIEHSRDYTNKEITRLLYSTDMLTTFTTIATRSQGILFNNEDINVDDFIELEKCYNEDFNE